MATILVGYDTETAAVGEALSLFTESPNFPLYELALDPGDLPRGARAADGGSRRRRRPRDALRLREDAAPRPRAGASGEGLGPLRRAAAHVQPRAVQGHRLLARPGSRRHDCRVAARGAARGADGHVPADPRPSRRRDRRPANAVRLLPRPARPAGPARDRARRRASLHHLLGSQRGQRATRRRGSSRSPTRRRATPTSSSCRSSSGSTSSGSTSTGTTPGPPISRR